MPMPDEEHTGTRIREQRKLAHLTQRQLAARISFSYSLLNQVECGARAASTDQAHAMKELPASVPTSRRAHFLIDRARSEMETGRTDAALKSLFAARRAAPEQTRYHPGARETISGLVHLSGRAGVGKLVWAVCGTAPSRDREGAVPSVGADGFEPPTSAL